MPGVRAARVVVIGAGHVGWNAAWIAQGMEAEVLLLDRNIDRLRWVDQIHRGRILTLASNRGSIERALLEADLLIGAVLVAGGRATIVVTDDMVAMMRPGSVIVDVAVDQGAASRRHTRRRTRTRRTSCTAYSTTPSATCPAAVPHTSTYALTNATLPYVLALAEHGVAGRRGGCRSRPARLGVNTAAMASARIPPSPPPSASTSSTR